MKHIFGVLGVLIILWFAFYYPAKKQADVFNKVCQPIERVTTWDAMWVDLKVGSCVIGNHRDG